MADLVISPYTMGSNIMAYKSVVPRSMSHQFLQEITNNFSGDNLLGKGAFGTVYKGVQQDGEMIAVKMLHSVHRQGDNDEFEKEFHNLASVHHPNIVPLVGFCDETRRECVPHNGNFVLADNIHRALCFQYMHNGSLEKYLSDESNGHDWHKRFRIIMGICLGLKCLHEESYTQILHLDLKPANILLDDKMEPKIADFGLSRLLGDNRTLLTKTCVGTLGYMPPEIINGGVISKKFDIFSLGVVILEIMAGLKAYAKSSGLSSHELIENVHGMWMNRLKASPEYAADLDSYREQVKRCIEIALECLEMDRHKRPSIGDIVDKLKKTETMIHFPPTNGQGSSPDQMNPFMSGKIELLDVHPLQLCFPFEPNKLISCPLHIKNKTCHHVSFQCLPKIRDRCFSKLRQLWGTLPPRSTRTYIITVEKQQQQPPDMDELAVIQSCVVPSNTNGWKMDFTDVIRVTRAKAYEVTLMGIFSQAGNPQTSEPIRPVMKMIQCEDGYGEVLSIDIHPKAPWILTSHSRGHVFVWNYDTQKKVMAVNVREEAGLLHSLQHSLCSTRILSAKFAPKDWFAVGDHCGYIHVHGYMPNGLLKILKAHSRMVSSLAIHPSEPLLLSSSCDGLIKLWNWEAGWECTASFESDSSSIVLNPQNDGTFASASDDHTVKIWNIYSPDRPVATLDCHPHEVFRVDYFTTGGDNWYIITGSVDGIAHIWDLRDNTLIDTLEGSEPAGVYKYPHVTEVGVTNHLDVPPLLIVSCENVVSLFNSTNYRRENTIEFNVGQVYGCVHIKRRTSKDSKDMLAVAIDGGIAMMEINHNVVS